MVLGQVAAVLHGSPALPVLVRPVDGRGPDLLSPDDVLEVQSGAVPHAPLGDFLARESSGLFTC